MFGLGFWEISAIVVVALIFLGPKKLPDVARSLGKSLRELRRVTDDFKSAVDTEAYKPDPLPAIVAETKVSDTVEETARDPSEDMEPVE